MHIPSSMLQGSVCPVSATLSVVGIAAAAYFVWKAKKQPSAGRFAAVSSLIFAAQMLNFPVLNGTSGHFLGGVATAALLGTPMAILSLTIVVSLQALLFADGGLNVLGANILNMAIIGAGCGGLLLEALRRNKIPASAAIIFASVASVLLAAVGVCVELAASGAVTLTQALPSMLGVHALIGLGEGVIAIVAIRAFKTDEQKNSSRSGVWAPLAAAMFAACILSPLACGWPDGLEWVGTQLNLLHQAAPPFVSIMPDYAIASLGSGAISTALAGGIGVIAVMAVAYVIMLPLKSKA